jgi:hypothetical protein
MQKTTIFELETQLDATQLKSKCTEKRSNPSKPLHLFYSKERLSDKFTLVPLAKSILVRIKITKAGFHG